MSTLKKCSVLGVILLFLLIMQGAAAQNLNPSIIGTVTSESGDILSGVTVVLKEQGTLLHKNTTTNNNGIFKIDGLESSVKYDLTFSYVGYETYHLNNFQIKRGSENSILIRLKASGSNMDEVVVTALNIKRNARTLGYSISTIDGNKVNTVQTPNLINALSGKIAGVDVGNIANGVAGTKRIVIRGASSLTGNNQPLWVVDGIPINTSSLGGLATNTPEGGYDYGDGLTGINPDDIETISVLKGNAAAALYGSRASNGVIIVTTKSGNDIKGKYTVDVSSSALFDKLIDPTDFQNIYGQSATNQISGREIPTSADNARGSDSWGHIMDGTPAPQFDGVVRPFNPVKDNYKRFFNTGSTINNTVALSGNSQNHNYRVSLSDLRNKDIVPNSKFTRTTLNTKGFTRFGKMDVDVVMNYLYEKANNRPYIGGNHDNQFYSLLYLPNSIDIESLKPGYDSTGREFLFTQGVSNPFYVINKEVEVDTRNRINGALILKYQIASWLYARGRFTRDYYLAKRLQYIPDNNVSSSYPYNSPSNIGGLLNQRSVENAENNYEFLLGVNPEVNGKFNASGFLGANINWRTTSQSVTSGNTFIVPGVYTFNNLKTKLPSTGESRQRTNSLFGSLELSYNNYLYLTLTGRNDWFSTLPIENNNLFYPAASLSFIFSDAFKMPSWISFGKFRTSAAQVSGDTGPYQLDLSYSLDALLYNSALPLQMIGTSQIPNKYLKPLLSSDYEIGLDMDFIKGRVGFEATYYSREIKNDIVKTAVSNTTGYTTAILNVGRMKNSGFEFLLRATPVKTKNFNWDISASFSTNDNKVIALGDGTEGAPIQLATSKSGNAAILLSEGKRYAGIYGFSYKRDSATGKKIYDTRGFPVYNSQLSYLGSGTYDKLLGVGNTFRYKSFSLYLFLDGKFGAHIYSESNATAYKNGKHKATLVGREEGLIAEGLAQDGSVNTVKVAPDNIGAYYNQIGNISEQFIYNASFVKVREAALSYKIPNTLTNSIHITNATLSFVVRNLFTLYKNKNLENIDPESNTDAGNQQGIERMVYPPTRNFGVTLKFGIH